MDDHLLDFEVRPGRIRNDGRQVAGRSQRLSRLVAKPARTRSPSGGRGTTRRPGVPGRCQRTGNVHQVHHPSTQQIPQRIGVCRQCQFRYLAR